MTDVGWLAIEPQPLFSYLAGAKNGLFDEAEHGTFPKSRLGPLVHLILV